MTMTINPAKYLRRRERFDLGEIEQLERWLVHVGWVKHHSADIDEWQRPGDSFPDWSFSYAVHHSAEVETAKLLRANGWFAPYEYGHCCLGKLCRAPGTWQKLGTDAVSVHGSGGKWLTISQAAKQAGLK